ncbi:MAG: glycosyltransferase [Anaerolineae bacterium]|nr:glycosyltransferase [Anaerolineae bacterium]
MLTPQIPYPPRQGTALRNWGLLQGLSARHRVSLLTFAAPDQDVALPDAITTLVARATVFPQPVRTLSQRLRTLLSDPRPDLLLRLESPDFRQQMQMWLDEFKFDWVQIEGLELTGYLDLVRACTHPPRVVFDDHNCEYLLQRRASQADMRRPSRWIGAAYSAVQWRRLLRHERAVCRSADMVVTVSHADADALRNIAPGLEPLLVPNGITMAEYTGYASRAELRQPAFVFTGTMNFRPNVDGVLWFAHNVWPRILAALPEAHFYIVGRSPHKRLSELNAMPGVIITGAVPDTRPYINAAAVYVVPLLVGGGTRLKILEATAMDKTVVSTTLGAEGFPDAGRALILADAPADFADACIRLAQRSQDATHTHAFAEAYDWQRLLPPLLERLETAGGKRQEIGNVLH